MQSTLFTPLAAACIAVVLATGCSKSADSNSSGSSSSSASDAQAKGAAIFSTNCAGCHGANGAGGGVGPALVGEKNRKNLPAAIAWIKNPQAPMPKLYPSPLSESDVADVAAYVESL